MNDKDWIKKFETLHGKHSKVFSGMGLLKDYECELKLAEDTPEFFYRPSLVPVHLQDRATERLNEYVRLGLFEWVPQGTPIKYSSSPQWDAGRQIGQSFERLKMKSKGCVTQ